MRIITPPVRGTLPQNRRTTLPWSKISLVFLMVASFLIFASLGAHGAENTAHWGPQVGAIIAGTSIFSLASILLVWAGRMVPKNL